MQPLFQFNIIHIHIFLVFLLLFANAARLEVGDACTMKSERGVCKRDDDCPVLNDLINRKVYSKDDIENCGFYSTGELICCPILNGDIPDVPKKKEEDILIFLGSTQSEKSLEETTTEFWRKLLLTTTSTTTVKPLVVNGQTIDKSSEFIDLSQLLNKPVQNERQNNRLTAGNNNKINNNNGIESTTEKKKDTLEELFEKYGNASNGDNISSNVSPMPFQQPNPNNMILHENKDLNQRNPKRQDIWQNVNDQQNIEFSSRRRTTGRLRPHANEFEWHNSNSNPGHRNHNFRNPQGLWNQRQRNDGPFVGNWQNAGIDLGRNNPEFEMGFNTVLESSHNNFRPSQANDNVFWPTNNNNNNNNKNRMPFSSNRDPVSTVNQNLRELGISVIPAVSNDINDNRDIEIQRHHQPTIPERDTETATTVTNPFSFFQFQFDNHDNNAENLSSSRDDQQPTMRTTAKPTSMSNERPAVAACNEIRSGLPYYLSQHVIGGIPVAESEYPHMGAIGFVQRDADTNGPYEYNCGGSLIAKKFVLTAAHCVNVVDVRPAIVVLGLVDLKDPEQRKNAIEARIKNIHIHKEYLPSSVYNDVALLELEQDVKYTKNIYPICLYADAQDPPDTLPAYVSGWGSINTRSGKRSDILLKAKLSIVDIERCNQSYLETGLNRRIRKGVQEQQVCAIDASLKRDACQGDSGGPLQIIYDESTNNYSLVGVVSAGFSCAGSTPGIYARVSYFLDFIESIVWPQT